MKNRYLWIALFFLVGMGACAKDHEAVEPEQTMQVMVQIAVRATTKAFGPATGDGSVAAVENGTVFFLSAEGLIVSRGTINKTQIITGQLFNNINSTAKEVYVVANYKANSTTDLKLTACTTKAEIMNVSQIIDVNTGIPNVTLVNSVDFTGFDANKDNGVIVAGSGNRKAYVLLCPALARIEITDIQTVDPVVVEYTLAGLYIDNFYPSFYMACGKGGVGTRLFGGTTNQLASNNFPQKDGQLTKSIAGVARPVVSNPEIIWLYHTTPTLGGGIDLPRVVVVFESVTIRVGATTKTLKNKYLTVTGYFDSTNTPIAKLEAGKVYRTGAGKFLFRYGDLADTPNPEKLDVSINVQILSWSEIVFPPVAL
ncbi:MAG: hypothetical protein RR522_00110 [Alistipes sp.]